MSQGTEVQILGQSYTVHGDLEPEYVRQLAAYVNEKMDAIAARAPMMEKQKVAVLAALAIADSLHTVRDELEGKEEIFKQQTRNCLALVEKALQETGAHDSGREPDGK